MQIFEEGLHCVNEVYRTILHSCAEYELRAYISKTQSSFIRARMFMVIIPMRPRIYVYCVYKGRYLFWWNSKYKNIKLSFFFTMSIYAVVVAGVGFSILTYVSFVCRVISLSAAVIVPLLIEPFEYSHSTIKFNGVAFYRAIKGFFFYTEYACG